MMKEFTQAPSGNSIVGQTFADRFIVKELLGTGGMGDVYLAEDKLLDGEQVALKILHKDLGVDDRHAQRFLREIRVTRQITHPNVVRTFDVGQHRGQLFFSMEFVQGTTLRNIIEDGTLTVEQTLPIISQILRALDAIHAAEIIHRDLKPSNVLILADGTAKVMDFGVARPARSELTGQHEVVGSALFMAPEQWVGGSVGPATDYYALGAIWYELLTGVTPFESENAATLMYLHLQQAVVPPIELMPELPANISNIITGLLAKEPVKRSLTVERLRALLAAMEKGECAIPESDEEPPFEERSVVDLSLDMDEPVTDRAVSWLEGDAFVAVQARTPVKLRPLEADNRWKRCGRSLGSVAQYARFIARPFSYLLCILVALLSQNVMWEEIQGALGYGDTPMVGVSKMIVTALVSAVAVMLIAVTPWFCSLLFLSPVRPHFRVMVTTGILSTALLACIALGLVGARTSYSRDKDSQLHRHLVAATSDATVVIASAMLGHPHMPSQRVHGSYSAAVRRDWYGGISLVSFVALWLFPLLLIRTSGFYLKRTVELYAISTLLASVVLTQYWQLIPIKESLPASLLPESIVVHIGVSKLVLSDYSVLCTMIWYFVLGCILALFLGRERKDSKSPM